MDMADYMRKRRAARRKELEDLKGGKCEKCGSDSDLHFDHRDRSDRKFRLSGAGLDKSWDSILKELDKCDLLCSSCHLAKTIANKETGGGHNKIPDDAHGSEALYRTGRCSCEDCRAAAHNARVRRGELKGTRGLRAVRK